jgi:Core-2/I-Branching enzyme
MAVLEERLHAGGVTLPFERCHAPLTRVSLPDLIGVQCSRRPLVVHDPVVRIAYVVVSHRSPDQVLRLVSALKEGPGAEVLVRHDPRREAFDESALEPLGAHALHDDVDFGWGGWTQLVMLLAALERTAELLDPDWVLVLSGQDYPLRPMAAIEDGLAAERQDALLGQAWELDHRRRPEPPKEEFFLRYAYRHYTAPAGTPHLPRRVRSLAYLRERPGPLRPQLGLRRTRLPFDAGFRCFVSADWLTLNRKALQAVLTAARERRELMRYYRRVAIPSESFFATVLLNDDSLSVARDNGRFVWFESPDAPHPKTLTSADLDRVLASGCDFARKFDMDADPDALDALDERRRSRSPR